MDQTRDLSLTFRPLLVLYSGRDESADSHRRQYVPEMNCTCCSKEHTSESSDSLLYRRKLLKFRLKESNLVIIVFQGEGLYGNLNKMKVENICHIDNSSLNDCLHDKIFDILLVCKFIT